MQRRSFITLLGGAAAAWPLAARAQQAQRVLRVGVLISVSPVESVDLVTAFRQGLRETGLVEGRNFVFEYRWAQGKSDRLLELAANLVEREVAVIAASDTPSTAAAQAVSTTTPIVSMSYLGNNVESYRAAGVYVGRILKGEKLSDPPMVPPGPVIEQRG